jgi:hypothetical protein
MVKPQPGLYKTTVTMTGMDFPGMPAGHGSGQTITTEDCLTQQEVEKGFEELVKQGQDGDAAEGGQVGRRLMQPPGPARLASDRLHPVQDGLVEGLAVRLGHVVGELDEGHGPQGDDGEGAEGGEFGPRHGKRAAEKRDEIGRWHRSLTAKLETRSGSRFREFCHNAASLGRRALLHRVIPCPEMIRNELRRQAR